MSPLEMPNHELRRKSTQESQQRIRDHVCRAMYRSQDSYAGHERRRKPRVPFPYPVFVTPVDSHGTAEIEKTFTVIGRHLSECGLDFYHNEPVAQKQLIISLDDGDEKMTGIVLELTWCRFLRHGWYQNGGRFVSIAPSQSPYGQFSYDFQLDGCL